MPKSKLSAVFYLLVVFLSGALVGTFSYRLYSMKTVDAGTAPPPRPTPEQMRKRYVEDLRKDAQLDDRQLATLNEILDGARGEFDQLRSKMRSESQAIQNRQVDRINAMLTPEQQAAFAKFRAERDRIRREMREKQQQQGKK